MKVNLIAGNRRSKKKKLSKIDSDEEDDTGFPCSFFTYVGRYAF
jgi:hypothetical protein